MKPTDLQTGDFIKYLGNVYIVEEISAKGWVHLIYPKTKARLNMASDYIMDLLEPIPLTLEILERNKFELRDGFLYHRIDDKPHHYDFKLKNGGVFTSEGYTLECGIYHLTIRYVHELQNALRLCGLNELADDFKLEE